jgi:hypothetical protein
VSHPQFLADHDLNEIIIHSLWRREPTIVFGKLREVGLDRKPDEEVLAFAAAGGLIVVSHDVNTMPAAAYDRAVNQKPMGGLLMVHQGTPFAAIIDDLLLIWAASEAEEWVNQVMFLPL